MSRYSQWDPPACDDSAEWRRCEGCGEAVDYAEPCDCGADDDHEPIGEALLDCRACGELSVPVREYGGGPICGACDRELMDHGAPAPRRESEAA